MGVFLAAAPVKMMIDSYFLFPKKKKKYKVGKIVVVVVVSNKWKN
jgi:hypothetical protein